MKRIKLDAIESTNTFLKDMVAHTRLEEPTVVSAEMQTRGRGQVGASWESEPSKNLLFSVFLVPKELLFKEAFFLSYAVSLALHSTLASYSIAKLSVKWPNDILSGSSKLGGILIENSFRAGTLKHSIIGVGLNVNQVEFSSSLPNASSLKTILGTDVDREELLQSLVVNIQSQVQNCRPENFEKIKKNYTSLLYKQGIPSMFKEPSGNVFLGKIVGVSSNGRLQIAFENESVRTFGLKEVELIK
jgi:BirA family transcriptional regulator, biotin operon repressor / biotin---[acetyl-CoA-carboxylase] ligase